MKVTLAILLLVSIASIRSPYDQIMALLQTATKALDAIDSYAQFDADYRNTTDELVGAQQFQYVNIEQLNNFQRLNHSTKSYSNNQLKKERNYNKFDKTQRIILYGMNKDKMKSQKRMVFSLMNNVLATNCLEALEVVKVLKQDVAGYIINSDSFEFVQEKTTSVAEKLKAYSYLFNEHEVKTILNLAQTQQEEGVSKGATLAERVLSVLNKLKPISRLPLKQMKLANLKVEYERKQVYADSLATQIQEALAQQVKSKIILQESQYALDQAQADLEGKIADYAEAKAKRDEENAIWEQIIIIFKKQVASWSERC